VLYNTHFADNVNPHFGVQFVDPGRERVPAWIAQRFDGSCHAAIMTEVMLDRRLFLFVRILLPRAHRGSGQILALFEFPMPALERILCRITQLPKDGSNAFPELYIEFDCSNAVFVRVHELPPSSPRIPPPPWGNSTSALTHNCMK
jgi:hypothetical protein